MSIRVMSEVWDRSTQKGAALLLLLALADHANDKGDGIRVGRARMKAKIRAKSLRTVDALTAKLCESGELTQTHKGGNGPGDVHQYRVNVARLGQSPGRPQVIRKGAEIAPIGEGVDGAKGAESAAMGAEIAREGAKSPVLDPSKESSKGPRVVVVDSALAKRIRSIKWILLPGAGIKGKNADRLAILFGTWLNGVEAVEEILRKSEDAAKSPAMDNPVGFRVACLRDQWEEVEGKNAWDVADLALGDPDTKRAVSARAFDDDDEPDEDGEPGGDL